VPPLRRPARFNTLNVYNLVQHPLRLAASDHLFAFRRYGRGRHFYLNLGVREAPDWLEDVDFDAVIYHTTFFSQRWAAQQFLDQLEAAAPLKKLGGVKVALPQDEFLQTRMLNDFMTEFEIDHIFSVAAESEWPKIYPGVDRERVGFTQLLTGYLDDRTRGRLERFVKPLDERPTDVGYRAWAAAPWLGRHGVLKRSIGERVEERAGDYGLVTDLSNRDSDVFNGDDWLRFLCGCKYTLGVEGGASLLHPDSEIIERTERYVAAHPDADFDQIEAACFPGEDGRLSYFAIGPRHIEACATRTCQVLVEGDYQEVLRPGEHYIELKADLSNLDQVLETMRADELREQITERAYADVIASGRYSYREMVRTVEQVSLAGAGGEAAPLRSAREALLLARDRLAERIGWGRVIYRLRYAPRVQPLLARISPFLPHHLLPAVWRRARRTLAARGSGSAG
jgi:ketosteroid isomerase-like protein